jgi:transcriptional regulator with GAF, ATPase, and Fis domain
VLQQLQRTAAGNVRELENLLHRAAGAERRRRAAGRLRAAPPAPPLARGAGSRAPPRRRRARRPACRATCRPTWTSRSARSW